MIKFKIDEILKEKNKTTYWLSRETKISPNSMSKIVKNETTSIKFDILNNIIKVLDCKLEDIIEYIPDKKTINE